MDEDKPEEPAPVGGEYDFMIGYACTCGKSVGVCDPGVLQAAVNNGAIRIQHAECGAWMVLTPRVPLRLSVMGQKPAANRHDRRAGQTMQRTKGGILVPR